MRCDFQWMVIVQAIMLISVVGNSTAEACPPQLIAEMPDRFICGCRTTATRIHIYLADGLEREECVVGRSRDYGDGETGVYDFHATTPGEEQFGCVVEFLLNGSDDSVGFWVETVDGRCGSGTIVWESMVTGGDPDLIGNEIDFIRLAIDSLEITSSGDWLDYAGTLRWQIWGWPASSSATPTTWGLVKSIFRLPGEER